MADGRMLRRAAATDHRLAQLSDRAELLFVKSVPHLDRAGRMLGYPAWVRGVVVPRRPWSDDDVEAAMLEWTLTTDVDGHTSPVAAWYQADGVAVVQFDGFTQKGSPIYQRVPPREQPSSLPAPPGDLFSLVPPVLDAASRIAVAVPPAEAEVEVKGREASSSRAGARERGLLLARFESLFGRPARLRDAQHARLDAALGWLGVDAAVTLLEERAATGAAPNSLAWFLPALEDRVREVTAIGAQRGERAGAILRACDAWFDAVGWQMPTLDALNEELETWLTRGLEPASADAKREAWRDLQTSTAGSSA